MFTKPTGDARGMSGVQTHAHVAAMAGKSQQTQHAAAAANAGLPGWKGAVQQIGASAGANIGEHDVHSGLQGMVQAGQLHPDVAQGVASHNGPLKGPLGAHIVQGVVAHIAKSHGARAPHAAPGGPPPGAASVGPPPGPPPGAPPGPPAGAPPGGPPLPPVALAAMAKARARGGVV